MRNRVTAITLVSLAACTPAPSPPPGEAASQALFREISIQPFGTVSLSADFAQRHTNAAPLGSGLYVLNAPRGSFGDTDSILVHVDGDNRVTALDFVYQAGKDFAAALAAYDGSLGAPASRTVIDSAGGQVERATWEDARTRFELARFSTAGRPSRVVSRMVDRTAPR